MTRKFRFERLEDRRVMAADWTNADNALDVNDSGLVTPLDVLLVANDINEHGVRVLPILDVGTRAATLVDVNSDGVASGADALRIINALNFYVEPPSIAFATSTPAQPGSEFVGRTIPNSKVVLQQLAAVLPVKWDLLSNADGELAPINVGALGMLLKTTVVDPLGRTITENLEFRPGAIAPLNSSFTESSGPSIGQVAPAVTLPNQNGVSVSLSDKLATGPVVLYFYPKDNTPKCTVQAQDLRTRSDEIQSLGATILGVSVDPVESHLEFANTYNLNFDILSDTARAVSEAYGVLTELNGNAIALRTTYIIDSDGVIREILRDVDVATHTQRVIDVLKRI